MTDALDGWIQQIPIPAEADLKFSESNDGPPKFEREIELSHCNLTLTLNKMNDRMKNRHVRKGGNKLDWQGCIKSW